MTAYRLQPLPANAFHVHAVFGQRARLPMARRSLGIVAVSSQIQVLAFQFTHAALGEIIQRGADGRVERRRLIGS